MTTLEWRADDRGRMMLVLTFASRRRGWAFIVPTIALGMARTADSDGLATGGTLLAVTAVCAVGGALWQMLYRRDLVDRLTYFAAAMLA